MKKAFNMKLKAFFIIFEGLSLKQIKNFFWKVRVQFLRLPTNINSTSTFKDL